MNFVRDRQYEPVDNQVPLTPSVLRVADQVEKASEASMPNGALSTHRLHDIAEAEQARKEKGSGKVWGDI